MASLATVSKYDRGASSDESSGTDSDNSIDSEEIARIQLIEGRIKVGWTAHGGGSDGYYFREKPPSEGEKDKFKATKMDFINIKDLLEDINTTLRGMFPGEPWKQIEVMSVFRWTSPGASIVSNEDIDDVFRAIFQHPTWVKLYKNKRLYSRDGMGKNEPHLPQTVGSGELEWRGPGELLKDLQVFTYRIGDEEKPDYIRQIFLNELISSEYQSKFTQSISTDFDFWMSRDDGLYGGKDVPELVRKLPDEWTQEGKGPRTTLKDIHDDILLVGKGSAGLLGDRKMADVIKEIIIKCAALINDKAEWDKCCKHWEFYPVSCSPITGVEGKKELMKVPDFHKKEKKDFAALQKEKEAVMAGKKKIEHDLKELENQLKEVRKKLGRTVIKLPSQQETLQDDQKEALELQEQDLLTKINTLEKPIALKEQLIKKEEERILRGKEGIENFRYKRFNNNPGLWFIYMLNIAKRCRVFHQGRENIKKFVESSLEKLKTNLGEETQEGYVYEISPTDHQFQNTFDCLDPDERKDLYIDIGQFLYQVRQNEQRKLAGVPGFNEVLTYTSVGKLEEEKYNLFDDRQFGSFMKKLQEGTYLDGRRLLTMIEEDWTPPSAETLKELGERGEKVEISLIEHITGYVDAKYLELSAKKMSPVGDVKVDEIPIVIKILFYVIFNASDPMEGIAKKYRLEPVEKGAKKRGSTAKGNVDRSMGWGLFQEGYDFSTAVHGFIRSVTNRLYRVKEEFGAERMKTNIRSKVDQLQNGFGETIPIPVPGRDDLKVEDVHSFLTMAVDYKKDVNEAMRDIMTTASNFKKLQAEAYAKDMNIEQIMEAYKEIVYNLMDKQGYGGYRADDYDRFFSNHSRRFVKQQDNMHAKVIIDNKKLEFPRRHGGKKRKKRTRRKGKKKRKRTRKRNKRKCKKRMKKKIICLSAPNKKATRKLIRVTKKLARMKGIKLSKCSKQRIKKWAKRKKRTRRRRKR